MNTFNMLCCSVTRNIFNVQVRNENGVTLTERNNQYKILQYINFSSLILHDHIGENLSIDKRQEIEEKYKKFKRDYSQFRLRCSFIDITNSAIEFLSQLQSDYLILDNGFARYDYIMLEDNKLITNTNKKLISFLAKNKYISSPKKYLSFTDFSKSDIEKKIAQFCKLILSIYRPEQIIVIEIKPALFYYCNNRLNDYNVSQNYIKRYKYCFHLLKKNINGCIAVNAPNILLGGGEQIWKLCHLHYTNDVNDIYYYKQLDYFVKNKDLPSNIIKNIYNEYHTSVSTKYFNNFYDLFVKRYFLSNRYQYLISAHNTALFLNVEYFYILNLNIQKNYDNNINKLINILNINDNFYLFVIVNNLLYYIKHIDIFGNVELSNEMCNINVEINFDNTISIYSENKFLSAREDTSCIFVDRNKAWERFKII